MLTRVPLRAVLFDWDGTLLDSYRADGNAYLQMFRALGITWGLAELAQHYSPDWHRVYRATNVPEERWKEADKLWRGYYRAERPTLQPGTQGVIRELSRRYRLGLVTSGSASRVRTQLRAFGLEALFAVRVFGDEIPRRKPHPAQLVIAMRRLGLAPAACVYVGVVGHSPVPERLRASRPNALILRISALPGLLSRS